MRRDPLEIMEEIISLLEGSEEALTVNAISERTGIHNITVKRYVKIIEMVRSEPAVEIIRAGRSVILRVRKRKDL